MMEIDSLEEALRDFDKKAKKEPSPLLEQFLCHVAKTGQTMVPWSQFKNYFLFKLEKVMDDFRASAPEQRASANPNVESVPFEDMKERILKIVKGYNGIPFTIQRLCELLTEPKRNYTGTDKFLRGVEKNVMVVSCVHPTLEKNGCLAVNRMNGVMLPGNTSAFTERKVNGPGTPRPLSRPKVSLANSLAANGLPDSTDIKDLITEQENKDTSNASPSEGSPGSAVKNKHSDEEEEEEEDMEAEHQEVKRLKFCKDEEEEDDEEEDEEQEAETPRSSDSGHSSKEAEAMVQEEDVKEREASSTAASTEEQEPTSSTPTETHEASNLEEGEQAEREVPRGSEEEGSDMDQMDQQAPSSVQESPESSRDGEESSSSSSDPVSSSSSSSNGSSCSTEEGAEAASGDAAVAPSSSTTEPPTEGATSNTDTTEEPMEQD